MNSPQLPENQTPGLDSAPSQSPNFLTRAVRKALQLGMVPINAAVTLSQRTNVSRWRRVATQEPPWDERNRLIASHIPEKVSVLDLGSGAMTLRRHLKAGCQYQPCDVVQSAPEVLLCDFNSGKVPALPQKYDFVVCSGVLEYIHKPNEFLSLVSTFGATVLLSYNAVMPGETRISRLGKGWVNAFTQEELESHFERAGLSSKLLFKRVPNDMTFELKLRDPDSRQVVACDNQVAV